MEYAYDIINELRERKRAKTDAAHKLHATLRAKHPLLNNRFEDMLQAAASGGDITAEEDALSQALQQALALDGYPADALEYKPLCTACTDTGYINGKLCGCVLNKALLRAQPYGTAEGLATFEQYNEDIYPDDTPVRGVHTQRVYMNEVRKLLEGYCADFPDVNVRNITLSGNPGLGKTFLLKCMRAALISSGVSCVSISAYRLNEVATAAMAGREDLSVLLSCGVLLIDDLGTEPRFRTTENGFFNVFNERLEAGLGTVTTTNLSVDEIIIRYGERTASRLTDRRNARFIPLYGIDIRKRG